MTKRTSIIIATIICILISCVGCGNQATENLNPSETTKIKLTKENAKDYILFTQEITNDVLNNDFGYYFYVSADLRVTTKAKKAGQFENVTITYTLSSESSGWEKEYKEYVLELPYNGENSRVDSVSSAQLEYKRPTSSPKIEIVIVDITGYFIGN